jgi:uncharacterized protein (TIGR00369 family)
MTFKAPDPDFAQRVTESFNRQQFMNFIGAELVEIRPGYCEIHLPYNEALTQQHGFFHAGLVGTVADNCAGYAAFSLMDSNASILTVEFKLNLLAPADGTRLIGKAEVIKSGRTLTICRSDIYIRKNGEETLCAIAQATLMQLSNTSDRAKG